MNPVLMIRPRCRLAAIAWSRASTPQPGSTGQHQVQVGVRAGDLIKGPDQAGDVLARFEGAHEGDEIGGNAEPVQHLLIGPFGLGIEAGVVDAVGNDGHRQFPESLPQSGRRVVAHTDEGGGLLGRPGNGPTKQHHLRPLVPLGVIEEGHVVDRHHDRSRAEPRHCVVRSVMHLRTDPAEDRRQCHLLPRQPQRTGVRRHGSYLGVTGQVQPSPAVPTSGQQGQVEIVTDAEMTDQFRDVPARSGRPGRTA